MCKNIFGVYKSVIYSDTSGANIVCEKGTEQGATHYYERYREKEAEKELTAIIMNSKVIRERRTYYRKLLFVFPINACTSPHAHHMHTLFCLIVHNICYI